MPLSAQNKQMGSHTNSDARHSVTQKTTTVKRDFSYEEASFESAQEEEQWQHSFKDVDKDRKKAYNNTAHNQTKEGVLNETEHQRGTLQAETLHSGRVYGDSENLGNKGRRNSDDNGNISAGNPEVESYTAFEEENRTRTNTGNRNQTSGLEDMGWPIHSAATTQTKGRSTTNGKRYLEAVKSGNESNYVLSMYGRNNFFSHINSVIDSDNLLFVSKKGVNKLINKKT